MSAIDVRPDQFDQEIQEGIVLVQFHAEGCGPCKMLTPIIKEYAEEENGTIKVLRFDVDEDFEKAKEFDIRGVPTLMLFKNGKPLGLTAGFMPKQKLIDWIYATLEGGV